MYRNIDIDGGILNLTGTYTGYGTYAILPKKTNNDRFDI